MATSQPHALRRRWHIFLCCAVAGFFSTGATNVLTAQAPADAVKSFDIPATTADKALPQFSDQAEREVLFGQATAAKVRTKAVKGSYTPKVALDLLLEGTGLVAVADEKTGAFSISRSSDPNGQRAAPTAGDRPKEQNSLMPLKIPQKP